MKYVAHILRDLYFIQSEDKHPVSIFEMVPGLYEAIFIHEVVIYWPLRILHVYIEVQYVVTFLTPVSISVGWDMVKNITHTPKNPYTILGTGGITCGLVMPYGNLDLG